MRGKIKVARIQGRRPSWARRILTGSTYSIFTFLVSRGGEGGGRRRGTARLHGHHRSQKEHHSKLITPFWHQHLSCLRLPKRTHFSSRLIADVSRGASVRRDITQRVFTTLLTFVTVGRNVRVRECIFFFSLLLLLLLLITLRDNGGSNLKALIRLTPILVTAVPSTRANTHYG